MRNRHVQILAAILTIFGLSVFAYKVFIVGFPLLPGQLTEAWDVEARLQFTGSAGPAKVSTFFPRSRPGVQIYDLRIVAKGYGISQQNPPFNRRVILATRNAEGRQKIYLKFLVHRFPTREDGEPALEPRIRVAKFDDASFSAAQELIALARQRSADTQTFVSALLKAMHDQSVMGSTTQLLEGMNDPASYADAAVAILSTARIAARRVNGIDLSGETRSARLVNWIEVYDDGVWHGYSVRTGNHEIPVSYVPWWYGSEPLVSVVGGQDLSHSISFMRVEQKTLDKVLAEGRDTGSEAVTLSLFALPLTTQQVYRVLTVVPLGIFLLVVIRNVIGIRTLGTFMPVLIALAFRETKLVWGLALFASVVGAGLLFRAYLEHLKLLLVPRLASVLIFVVLFMAALSVVSDQLGLQGGLSVALFPMVIMTMTIERVSVIWDELGPQSALKQASASLVVAALCYLIMSQGVVQHLFFTFPELLLVLLACTLLLGRYSGYRLLELPRFKVLARDSK